MTVKQWFMAMRPWSFTASVIPVVFGAAFAAYEGHFSLLLFILTLTGGVAVHAGTNLFNTYGDFVSGVDSPDSPKTCPQLAQGRISPKDMYRMAWLTFAFAGVIGIILTYFTGLWLLIFCVLGLIGGYCYTGSRNPYKYKGMGTFAVFFLMGPLMALPAYVIQTGHFAWGPVIGSLSIACLVAGILHANDIGDIEEDRLAGIDTLTLKIGKQAAVKIYILLNVCAFAIVAALIVFKILPLWCLVCFALLPMFVNHMRKIASPAFDFSVMFFWAAGFHMYFGALLTFGLTAAAVGRMIA